jgi:hypothetical protein
MVRYYGYYSYVSCGKRKMLDQDALISSILEPHELFDKIAEEVDRKRFAAFSKAPSRQLSWPILLRDFSPFLIDSSSLEAFG